MTWRRRALVAGLGVIVLLVVVLLASGEVRKLDFRRLTSRAGWQLPDDIVSALALEAGDRVADLGAGKGFFVPYLARAVGESGRVYAVEVASGPLESLRRLMTSAGLDNVEVVEGTVSDAGLPDGEIDLVFLCDVYHHIDDRVGYFDHLRRDLTAGGRVAIVEVRARGLGNLLSPPGHATPFDELVAEMGQAGYRLVESFDFLPFQNLFVFELAD